MRLVRPLRQPGRVFWSLALVMLVLDVVTKRLAELEHGLLRRLDAALGDLVSFPLTYNPGAVFSVRYHEDAASERYLQIAGTLVILAFLYVIYRRVASSTRMTVVGLGMMTGGGTGNLLDRLRAERGVVDFIHVDAGVLRQLVFNVADVAAFTGALLLLWALARREAAGVAVGSAVSTSAGTGRAPSA